MSYVVNIHRIFITSNGQVNYTELLFFSDKFTYHLIETYQQSRDSQWLIEYFRWHRQ